MRLDIDHSVDLSRDGESNSLGAHYSRQEVLGYKGASTKAAVALAHPTPAVLTGGFRISAPGLAFLSPVAAPPQAIPILQDYGVAQGRAPPSLHS
jgi:hypothetical protein